MDPAGAKASGATDAKSAADSLVSGTYGKTLKIIMARSGALHPLHPRPPRALAPSPAVDGATKRPCRSKRCAAKGLKGR